VHCPNPVQTKPYTKLSASENETGATCRYIVDSTGSSRSVIYFDRTVCYNAFIILNAQVCLLYCYLFNEPEDIFTCIKHRPKAPLTDNVPLHYDIKPKT